MFTLDELAARFEIDKVQKGGARFDRERLEWLNGQWIRRLDDEDLIERLLPFLEAAAAAGEIDRTPIGGRGARPPADRPRAAADPRARSPDLVGFLWVDELDVDPALLVPKRWDAATTAEALAAARETLAAHDTVTWEADELEPPLRELVEARGWKAGDLFMAIRVATTGRTATPPLFDTLVALGPRPDARAHRRRDRAARGAGGRLIADRVARPPDERSVNTADQVNAAMNTTLTATPDDPAYMARTILVVDDETTLRETLVEALELEGYRAVPAADGREALEHVPRRATRPRPPRPDAARAVGRRGLPDHPRGVGRPDHHADRQGRRGRQGRRPRARRRRLRHQAVQPARAHGADPGDLPASRAGRRGRRAAAVVDLGRVQVDVGGHRRPPRRRAVPLKPKAFDLLAFLLRHPGQVFTRDQLLEHVWGYDYAGETRTVDVHIHWLRSEIEADPATPEYLHTVRGVGYVFRRPG